MQNISWKSGQVLLIVIMIMATAITVVISTLFKSTTEVQINKQEEENQKALAAAEAGVEAAIKKNINGSAYDFNTDLGLNLNGFTGNVLVSGTTGSSFVTPVLQQDQEYTFYLDNYSAAGFAGTPFNGTLNVYYEPSGSLCSNNIVLELTVLSANGANYSTLRYTADTQTPRFLGSGTNDIGVPIGGGILVNNVRFYCGTNNNGNALIFSGNTPRLLIVRVLNGSTRLGFLGSTTLKPQGKYITSQANSNSGVVKKIQLFQSYPQIPSDFFVTAL